MTFILPDPFQPPLHDTRVLGAITEDEENMSEREEEKRGDGKQSGIEDNLFDFTNKSSGLTQADVDLLRKCQLWHVLVSALKVLCPKLAEQSFVCCLEHGKGKHQRALWLTLLASALLQIFVFNWMFCLLFHCAAGGIFQISSIVLSLIK